MDGIKILINQILNAEDKINILLSVKLLRSKIETSPLAKIFITGGKGILDWIKNIIEIAANTANVFPSIPKNLIINKN